MAAGVSGLGLACRSLPPSAFAAAVLFTVFLSLIARQFKVLPAACGTAGDVARLLCKRDAMAALDPSDEPMRTWLRVRAIVCDILGVEPGDVHPESRIIEDLGAT
jgi:hypothetical protein